MLSHDIVVVGASAGGLKAVMELTRQLPKDLPAAMFVVIHITPMATSSLASILNRAGPLPASEAVNGQPIARGRIYVARPNHHLLLREGRIAVVLGPKENRHRPSIDALFRTAARVYGARVIGIIMSGTGDDGVAGLRSIHARGGLTIVQDPTEATHGDLPRSALQFGQVDHVATTAQLGALLVRLVGEPPPLDEPAVTDELEKEARISEVDLHVIEDEQKVGSPSAFSCPDCGGVLWEVENGDYLRYRCRVGHAYSASALADEQDGALERALWAAFRTFEENASLARQLATRARQHNQFGLGERYYDRAEEAQSNADAIRRMIQQFGSEAHSEQGLPVAHSESGA